jgi:hypothetical protein
MRRREAAGVSECGQHFTFEVPMKKAGLRVMAGLAGATLCLFAVTTYAQNTNAPAGTPDQSAQTAAPTTAQPSTPTGDATTPATPPADAGTTNGTITSTATDVTTTDTTTRSFPGGFWGILAAAIVVLVVLFSLFRGKDRTVVKDTYVTTNTTPNTRSTGMGTASGDRVVTQRVASGTETTTRVNDPDARS